MRPQAVTVYPLSAYARAASAATPHFHVTHCKDVPGGRIKFWLPHRHDFFEVVWLRSGKGHVKNDFQSHPVRAGDLWFHSPDQVHASCFSDNAQGEIAGFTREFFNVSNENPGLLGRMPFLYREGIVPIVHLDMRERTYVEQIFEHLHMEAREPAPGRDDVVRAYFTILLTLVRRRLAALQPDVGESSAGPGLLVRRFRMALQDHFPRMLEVRQYAEMLQVSRSHLNAHLRRETGRSPSEIIHEHIALEAKRLLVHSPLTVSEIAYRLGFRDPSYFCRFFRKASGQAPLGFRSEAREVLLAG